MMWSGLTPCLANMTECMKAKSLRLPPPCNQIFNCEVVKGGTGYDLHKELPKEIDMMQPDYSIYPKLVDNRTSYGFLTRGCCNRCSFCVVPQKEGAIRPYMDIEEITQDGKRPWVILMDNNLLASGDYAIGQLETIIKKGYHIDLNQASSARLVTDDIAKMFAQIKWIGSVIRFAADHTKQITEVENAMERIDRYRVEMGKKPAYYLIYTIINDDMQESYERLRYFQRFKNVRIQAQPYRNFNDPNQVIPKWQMDMARWANRKELYKTCDFKDFRPRKNFVCSEYFK